MNNNSKHIFKKEFPYEDTYFDTLPQEIWTKIDAQNPPLTKTTFYAHHKSRILTSLVLLLFLVSAGGIFVALDLHSPSLPIASNPNIQKDTLFTPFPIQSLTQTHSTLAQTNITSVSNTPTLPVLNSENISQSNTSISQLDIENYLLNQEIDLSLYFE
ncbi:MAG: hypothetical protein RR190_04840 [Bacteroidales bacterium]